jgi:hypothetical protein
MMSQLDPAFMSKFDLRTSFDALLALRSSLTVELSNPTLKSHMRAQGDLKGLEFVVISESPDSEVATLFESLEEDVEDFFFNAKVRILSDEENKKFRADSKLPRSCMTPIKTFTHEDIKILIYKSANIKCIRCQKYSVESTSTYKAKPVMEKICPECQSFLNY